MAHQRLSLFQADLPGFRQTGKFSRAKEGQPPVGIIQFLFELIGSHCAARRSIVAFDRRPGCLNVRGAARKEQAGDGTQDLQLPLKIEAQVDVPADLLHTSESLSRPL